MQNGFPDRLRRLRKQKKLTQGQLGDMVEMHYQHIGRYERGLVEPSKAALRRLATALDVSAEYLVAGTGPHAASEQVEDQELLQQFREVQQLPEEDQVVVKKLLDAFLTKKKLQTLVAS